jgi:Glutathione S-transferase, C-terminal domain
MAKALGLSRLQGPKASGAEFGVMSFGGGSASPLRQRQIPGDAMPVDARGDWRALPADREEHAPRRFADRGIPAAQPECADSYPRGWRSGVVGIDGDQYYLAQKHQGPMRCDSPELLGLAAQWSFWAVLELEELLLDLLQHRAVLPDFARDPSHAERSELLLQKPLGVLDDALAGRQFLAGDRFTVADLNVASILVWGKMARLDFSANSNVARWLDVCLTRPAYRRVRDRTARK